MTRRRRAFLGLAVVVLLAPHAAAAQGALADRWHVGDPPPDVEGVRLGDSAERVVAALGEPDPSPVPPDPGATLRTMSYRQGALLIAIDRANGVARVMLRRPEGGALAGVRVGDRLGVMLRGWGEPTLSHGSRGSYRMGDWTIEARVDFGAQTILRLMLASAKIQPPAPPPAPPDSLAAPPAAP